MKKILDKITVTGADESTQIDDLYSIQEKYPFVEFGILIRSTDIIKSSFYSRFPSVEWLNRLAAKSQEKKLNLAMDFLLPYIFPHKKTPLLLVWEFT
jgi:hypothetical protein